MPARAAKAVSKTKGGVKSKRAARPAKLAATPALQAVHETAAGLYKAGVIDKTTMKEFDVLCLPKVPVYTPNQIRQIRTRCHASQAVFAKCFNVTASSLQKWETGTKKPNSVARKLLSLVDKRGLDILFE
jgi:putative transcriptional regulator